MKSETLSKTTFKRSTYIKPHRGKHQTKTSKVQSASHSSTTHSQNWQRGKKIAIIYDWVDKWGGAERLILELLNIFPQAQVFTSYLDPKRAPWSKNLKIKTSFLQKFPSFIKKSRKLSILFYPLAIESFDLSDYDIVISVSSFLSKGVITKPNTYHIAYILTPPRFLWNMKNIYLKNTLLNNLTSQYLRKWDYVAAQRADKIISISQHVQKRVLKYYNLNSEVIYPPFNLKHWQEIKEKIKIKRNNKIGDNFYLIVSRLEAYKKIDLAIKVFNKLPKEKLIIIGTGTEEKRLKRIASNNITFLSHLTDTQLATFYSRAKAVIMPQDEDFGLVALESQFWGTPVISFRDSGASEVIKEKETGLFFHHQTEYSLLKAIEKFESMSYNLKKQTKTLKKDFFKKFSREVFKNKFLQLIS